jgi:DNA repair exonuclease SbcCD nuclease subunit
MIRFIHAADPHLDSPLQGLEAHEGAPVEVLRGATRRAFENLVNLAIEESVDFVVIAGDLYDGDWKDYSTGLFFRAQMVRLQSKGTPVYLIAGNHDAASVITKKLSLPENVHVFSTRTTESLEVAGHPVTIHGRGFPNRAVPENLASEYPMALPGRFNLGLLHTSLTGRPGHDTYAPCSVAQLREKGYQYWALGHIHQPEVINKDPWIVFAGNCQGRHIKEAGARGCRLVTVSDSLQVEGVEWRSLDVVRWAELNIDLSGVETETEATRLVSDAMGKAVTAAEGRLVAARIILSGTTQLHGSLHRNDEHWNAQFQASAQDLGAEAIWIERITVSTSPVYDIAQLAERDALTKIVVSNLNETDHKPILLPPEIEEMLSVLPLEIRTQVEDELNGEQRATVLSDVRAIILDALATNGGQN